MKDKDWKMNRHVSNFDEDNYREKIFPERLLNVVDHYGEEKENEYKRISFEYYPTC